MRLPLNGRPEISVSHGRPVTGTKYSKHLGLDFLVKHAPVFAPAAGRITFIGQSAVLGVWVELTDQQDRRIHRFAHLSRAVVEEGEVVKEGQQIGVSGNTGQVYGAHGGYHLHWDVRRRGTTWDSGFSNYYDPAALLTVKKKVLPAVKIKLASIFKRKPKLRVYTVVKGDSLSAIAKRYKLSSWRTIYDVPSNKKTIGPDPDLIKPGQKLIIP